MEDDVWDDIQYKYEQGINLKIFLELKAIMYEGSLRYRESTLDKNRILCLSSYRRYVKNGGIYQCQKL